MFVLFMGEIGVYVFMENVWCKLSEDGVSFSVVVFLSLNLVNNVCLLVFYDVW